MFFVLFEITFASLYALLCPRIDSIFLISLKFIFFLQVMTFLVSKRMLFRNHVSLFVKIFFYDSEKKEFESLLGKGLMFSGIRC